MSYLDTIIVENLPTAIFGEPASSKDIAELQNRFLLTNKELPLSYLSFLKHFNGFAWNGLEFYGTKEVFSQENKYTLTDLFEENMLLMQGKSPLLILGRVDDTTFAYHTEMKEFQVLELPFTEPIDTYDDFKKMFEDALDDLLVY